MSKPDWNSLHIDEGVFREPVAGPGRIVLWLPGNLEHGYRHWERIGNVPGAEISEEQGICSTPATSLRLRQRVQGLLGRLLSRFRGASDEPTWLLPNGESAEQIGERRTDLLLTWSGEEGKCLDESQLRQRWGEG